MGLNFKVKFYQHLLQKSHEQGITWVDILIMMLVLGFFVAISLPYFLSGAPKAILAESRTYVGAMNRAQQAYFLENQGEFSYSISQLELGISEETTHYNYYSKSTTNAAFNFAIAKKDYIKQGWFQKILLKSVVGAVFVIPNTEKSKDSEIQTVTIVCINDQPGSRIPFEPVLNNGVPSCGLGTTPVK